MARDLEGEKVQLTHSPDMFSENTGGSEEGGFPREFVIIPEDQQNIHRGGPNLHPYTRPLTISDVEACVAVENSAFTNPQERATREKIIYRLTKCGELCHGIFSTVVPGTGGDAEALVGVGRPVETDRENGAISVLLGHVIASKTDSKVATDASMEYPRDWKDEHPAPSELGHLEEGRTIVLHSVAMAPQVQGRGLGRVLLLAYMQHMNGAGIADRLVLIAHDHMVPWYERLGFVDKGPSDCKFGGGGWHDMVFELKALEPQATYG